MSNIVLPKKVTFLPDEKQKHNGQIIIEPCYPGYGTTLGNAIRRVMLSSLPGAAVVGVKIKGVDHEFSAIEGVKEDALEILLNLKQLRLQMFEEAPETIGDKVLKLELKVKGPKKVTGADITKNSEIKVSNPDIHLFEITDKNTEIEMEFSVMSGYGYVPIEGREHQEKEVGYIDIDSVFSPVKSIKVEVENVRVGKMTNWDKLVIDVETDATITFEQAYKEVCAILVNQFSYLLENADNKKGKKASEAEEVSEENSDDTEDEKAADEADEEKDK
ncbi:MAG: DNA-directed RNA polymerase subunit alpha [bacterium]|nr:DNA-directed RNA polymerase subunit alpha [bacterium]